jgi:prevent-host-death family protein
VVEFVLYQQLWYNLNMEEIAASKFKVHCLSVIERVRKTRKPVRVTRYGKPVAEIVPLPAPKYPKRWLGDMAGTVEILGDIISPSTDPDEWATEDLI